MKKITAAEVSADGFRLYSHDGASFRCEIVPFEPFMLLSDGFDCPDGGDVIPLSGNAFFPNGLFLRILLIILRRLNN